MSGPLFDAQERYELALLLTEVGPDAPTLIEGWTTRDLAAHLVLREHDPIAAPGLALAGPYGRLAAGRQRRLARDQSYADLVERFRKGPPPGFFRVGWVRALPNLNECFVHHEDVRRANGRPHARHLSPAMEDALWRNVRRSARLLARRADGIGVVLERTDDGQTHVARRGEPEARLRGTPGELLLHLFGRTDAAHVDVAGPPEATDALRRTRFGM